MNKMLMFSIVCTAVSSLHAAVLTKTDIESAMTGAHTAAFGTDLLFKEEIAQKDINRWNDVITAVETFVKKNVVLNKDLTNAMQKLKEANDKMITAITESYHSFYEKKDLTKTKSSRNAVANALQYIIDDVVKIENQLNQSKTKGHRTTGNQNAAEILYRLAVSIATTAEKAQRELRK